MQQPRNSLSNVKVKGDMTATRTLYRKANVSEAMATASLFKRYPAMDLVEFVKKEATAEEAAAARAQEGDVVYAATIRVAEFPPEGGDKDSVSEEAPEEEAPEPKSDEKPESDEDSEGDSEFEGGDEFGEKGDEGVKPKKLSPEEQIVHLLQQILDALQGGGQDPLGGPDAGGGLDLPDVGAPDKGDPALGGPGGPGGPGKALPPPVHEKSPIGVGAFAHVTSQAEITMVREDASKINNKTILAEAAQYAPTHRVAKIQRTGLAKIGDDVIDLAEAGSALVTLVSK